MENDTLILKSLSGRRLSAAELIAETGIPSSTLYKRLARLKDDGLIEVHADPHDGRLKVYTLREAQRPAVRRRGERTPGGATDPDPGPHVPDRPAPAAGGEGRSGDEAQRADEPQPTPAPSQPAPPQPAPPPAPAARPPSPQSGESASEPQTPPGPPTDGPRALADAELDELAELLQRVDRLGLYRVPEYDALRRLLAREQAARGLRHSRAYA